MHLIIQTSLCLGVLFVLIGLHAFRTTKPMWFWPGTTINSESITDVAAYNRACAKMWWTYAVFYWLAAILYGVNPIWGSNLLSLNITLGVLILSIAYLFIRRHFKKR